MRFSLNRYSYYLFRLGIASLFLYFGILAVLEPEAQAQIWIAQRVAAFITPILPIATFMFVFGILQILVGLSLVFGYLARMGLLLAAAMLIGIIINLLLAAGFNDVVLRDIVILTGVIYLLL